MGRGGEGRRGEGVGSRMEWDEVGAGRGVRWCGEGRRGEGGKYDGLEWDEVGAGRGVGWSGMQ